MKDAPLMSVVMSFYNSWDTLGAAIASIQVQTFVDWELIVINDGSTIPEPNGFIEKYKDDQRIRFFNLGTNVGLASALNQGVQKSRSDIIVRMDSDDVSMPNRLAKQYSFLSRHPSVGVVGSFVILNEGGVKGPRCLSLPIEHQELVDSLYVSTPFIHPTVAIRKAVFLQVGGYDVSLNTAAQDRDLWFRLKDTTVFANIPEPLLVYSYPTRVPMKKTYAAAIVLWRHSPNLATKFLSVRCIITAILSATKTNLSFWARRIFSTEGR